MSSKTVVSSIGLVLCMAPGLLHSVEVMFPMLSRWIVNYVLPLFGPALPRRAESLTYDEQITMLDAALEASPAEKKRAGSDYIFLVLFEQRQGSLAFLAVVVGALYGLTLSVAERQPLHLVFAVMAVLFALVNANHAGIPFLGHHPKVSRNGRNVGLVFAPFWTVAAVLNWLAFSYAL
ncbi:MAG: hypothetical protein R6W79_04095 [Acidimicrobiia bacterium]